MPDAPSPPAAPPLRVLVVEDDPVALSTTVELLQLMGHWATGVKSAEVAKDRFIDGAFDILLTDIGLPALSGYDLVASLPEGRHRMNVIFATGQTRPARPMPNTYWLQKPFSADELAAALAESAPAAQPRLGEVGTG